MASFDEPSRWTMLNLFRSGIRVNPKTRSRPKPSGSVSLKNVIPYVGTKSLLLQFLHEGISLPMVYQVDLMWSGCEFVNEDPRDLRNWMKVSYKDFHVWVRKPDISRNTVRVRCACPDFYFTYAYQDWQQGALFGSKPKPYVRKTLHYPRRNPHNYAGCCKHIANSVAFSQNAGWGYPSPRLF